MEVIRADSAGACYGVERAIGLAKQVAASGLHAQTLGPLIHNPQVVAELAEQGVDVAQGPEYVDADTVIVRSHGISPQVARTLQGMGVQVVDATCPHVLRAQKAALDMAQEGLHVVVVGEAGHPEVEGLRAWAADAGSAKGIYVADGPEDLPNTLAGPVGVVAQTTQTAEKLSAVVAELERRGLDVRVSNTICDATAMRQAAAERLAAQVDAMVVVGGKNSSNTARLFEICQRISSRAFHVESHLDLKREDFDSCHTVGVSAGASTPESQIAAVEDCLRGW